MAYEIRRQRWRYSKAFKRRVVAETLEAGASVSAVARRHGLNANMVFMWRRDRRFGPGRERASFHPVEVTGTQVPAPWSEVRVETEGRIEIVLPSGGRLALSGTFDADAVLGLTQGAFAGRSPYRSRFRGDWFKRKNTRTNDGAGMSSAVLSLARTALR